MSKIDTWMPLYIGDYLADTTHLSMAEHGAYLLLIMTYWRNGPLPDNDKALANMAKCDRKLWMSEIGPVMREFFEARDGKLHHKRIDAELKDAAELSAKKQAAANARWGAKRAQVESESDAGGSPPADAHEDAGASPHALAAASASDDPKPIQGICPYAGALPSPSPSQVEVNRSLRSLPQIDQAFDEFWAAYPRKKGKEDARKRFAAVLKRFSQAEIMLGLSRQVWNADPNFIPHPATWLNQGRWMDEPDQPASKSSPAMSAFERRKAASDAVLRDMCGEIEAAEPPPWEPDLLALEHHGGMQ